MTFWVAGAVVGSAALGAYSSNRAASTQADAASQSAAIQKQISDDQIKAAQEQYYNNLGLQAPFREAGLRGLGRLEATMGNQPEAFSGKVNMMADPGYQFRLSEGMKGLEQSAAARGGLLSGAAGKALTRFGQDYASNEYQNAYGRALTEYNANVNREATGYNRLASLAGIGQTSAANIGQAGQNMTNATNTALGNYGQGASNALQSAGNARASGYVGGANALTSALGTGLNYFQGQNYLNALNNSSSNYSSEMARLNGSI